MEIEQIVAQLSEALSKATPGEWKYICSPRAVIVRTGDNQPIHVTSDRSKEAQANACLIALARNHLPALLTDRESLQQKIREQAEALKQCGGAIATFKQKRGNHPGEHVFSEEIQFCLLCDQSYVEAEPALDAVLALPLVREAMTQHEKVATDPK
jgi:hypothetical protein